MIVVTGATGNVGRPLVRALASSGEEVVAVSRGISPADVPAGVLPVRADLTEQSALKPALDGAEALFLLTSGELLSAEAGLDGILDAARSAGLRSVVLLSSQGVGTGRHSPEPEEAVIRSGLRWTVLRAAGFASNTFLWSEMVRAERMIAAPFGDVALPVIDPADIAEVAAAALRGTGHDGNTYELTGPALVSPRQQVAAIGDALGEPVRFVEQSRAQAREQMLRFMPGPVVDTTLDILGAPLPAERRVSPDVERILGRPARPFADWAARNIGAFT